MLNTGIYVRVSTEEQAREGYSIRAQEEKLKSYAKLKEWHIYGIYADEGISAKDIDGRPEMKRLIADIASGKVTNVLVYKIDRLTRSTKNLIELIDLFNQYQCAFNSLNEAIDTTTATGRMFLKIVGIFAEFERENLAERVRLGLERKAREGYAINSNNSSFGYARNIGEKIQTIEQKEAEIVRRIFDMYLHDDYSLYQIARTLNAENVSTKKGGKWKHKTVKLVLTNPNLIGKVRYACDDTDRYFEADGKHEPIIAEDVYYQVQEKLKKIKRITKTKRPTADVYFCGVMCCPVCGGKCTTKWHARKDKATGKNIAVNPSYCCANSMDDKCTSKITISHRKIERAFEQYISQIADFTETDNPYFNDETQTDHSNEVNIITVEIVQIERKTEEIMSLFVSNNIDFETYQGMVKLSNARRSELTERLNILQNIETNRKTSYSKKEILANLKDNWQTLDNDQRLQFVQKFIQKIVAHRVAQEGQYFNAVTIGEVVYNEF